MESQVIEALLGVIESNWLKDVFLTPDEIERAGRERAKKAAMEKIEQALTEYRLDLNELSKSVDR